MMDIFIWLTNQFKDDDIFMEKTFELNDFVNCPACGKLMEGGNFVARDFVPLNSKGYPTGRAEIICEYCQKTIVATPSADKQTITFSVK